MNAAPPVDIHAAVNLEDGDDTAEASVEDEDAAVKTGAGTVTYAMAEADIDAEIWGDQVEELPDLEALSDGFYDEGDFIVDEDDITDDDMPQQPPAIVEEVMPLVGQ